MDGPRRGAPARAGLPSALALLALLQLTCCVRCAGSARASNVVLVLVDDQDVQLGGMVSERPAKCCDIIEFTPLENVKKRVFREKFLH